MYDMLVGENIKKSKKQASLSHTILMHVPEITLGTWERIDMDAEFKGNYTIDILAVGHGYPNCNES